jgi:hypothetical protein
LWALRRCGKLHASCSRICFIPGDAENERKTGPGGADQDRAIQHPSIQHQEFEVLSSMTTSADRYAAFISYRHRPRDRQWALRIMAALETYRTPKPLLAEAFPARIGLLFRDEDEIPASNDLSDQIKDALGRSDNLIVVCSPDTPGSRWVRREIELFQEIGKGDRIFPLLIAGEPEESFPPELLRRRKWRDLPDGGRQETSEEIEPNAADVRPRKDESRARTERRGLLRLAAALLGCRFDDLARRDEERRKARLRKQLGAAATLLAVAGIGGLWWWDANLRVKTQYCAAYGERWAAPSCIAELSPARQRVRTTSYRLHVQGGRVLDMARVNGADAPVDRQNSAYEEEAWTAGVALWSFTYLNGARNSTPQLASAALYNETGKQLRQINYQFSTDRQQAVARFDRNFGVAERQSAAGSALGLRRRERYEISHLSNIGQHRLFFDAGGHLLRREFEPVGGGPSVADALGAYGRAYEYGAAGLPVTIRNLDARGEPLVEKTGIVSVQHGYDARGDLMSVEWLDAMGKSRANEQWFAKVVLVRDANGNIEKESYFSGTGAPTIRRDRGSATLLQKYDMHGYLIEEAYFGVDGKPTLTSDQRIARMTLRRDTRGREVERAFFDADDKPTVQKIGVARVTTGYDKRGNTADWAYFGVDGKPIHTVEGFARVAFRYDERGNEVEQAYFGVDGRPTLTVDGIARITWLYDERDNQVGRAFFGTDGKPALHKSRQLASETMRYDGNGNEVEAAFFGVDGKPTLSQEGLARITKGYDEHGNEVETALFGVDGKPAHKDGYTRWTMRYDERGNPVERTNFDVDGKPTINKADGSARSTYRYDERGNRVEAAFFGIDRKPTLNVQGTARRTSNYDERGNEIESAYFGVDGAPALNVQSSARITRSYDERGNQVAEAYFGVDGKPTLDASGTASSIFQNDERGNRLEETYFDVDGKPVLSAQGVARVTFVTTKGGTWWRRPISASMGRLRVCRA